MAHTQGRFESCKYNISVTVSYSMSSAAGYVHICANETIHGLEYHEDPIVPSDTVLVGDFTSTLLSRPVDWAKYGLVYASGGKNLGPAGVCTVIIRKDLLQHPAHPLCPSVLDYSKMAASKPIPNIYNTPPTFLIYMMSSYPNNPVWRKY
jgi:phosphoserine aminotransferase